MASNSRKRDPDDKTEKLDAEVDLETAISREARFVAACRNTCRKLKALSQGALEARRVAELDPGWLDATERAKARLGKAAVMTVETTDRSKQ